MLEHFHFHDEVNKIPSFRSKLIKRSLDSNKRKYQQDM